MNVRSKLGIGAVSLLVLGGSALTIAMPSAVASTTSPVSHAQTLTASDVNQSGDVGPNVQSGSQASGPDTGTTSESTNSEGSSSLEATSEADGPGGAQGDGTNVGSQVGAQQ